MKITATQIRELAAAGLAKAAIAAQLDVTTSRVTQTLKRSERRGRPGGQASLEDQIQCARRVAESTEDEQARALASQLLQRLLELE